MATLYNRYMGHPFRVFTTTLKTFFIAHVVWSYGIEANPSGGASMLPTFLVEGDRLVISKHYRRGRDVKVGDVVSFDSVYEPGSRVIKRVIGLEGDYVLRNTPGSMSNAMIQVPQGHCWVIGDNMKDSLDSRHWGPLPLALIKGKVIAKLLPWDERKWVENGLEKPVFG